METKSSFMKESCLVALPRLPPVERPTIKIDTKMIKAKLQEEERFRTLVANIGKRKSKYTTPRSATKKLEKSVYKSFHKNSNRMSCDRKQIPQFKMGRSIKELSTSKGLSNKSTATNSFKRNLNLKTMKTKSPSERDSLDVKPSDSDDFKSTICR